MTGALVDGTDNYVQWDVVGINGTKLTTGETWSVTFDMGTLNPRYTEAYTGRPETTRTDDGDSTFHLTYEAKPVVTTTGCDDGGAWPPACSTTATSWQTQLSGEVHDKSDFGNGYDRSQNADEVSGVFLETAPDGSPMLTSDMANSHRYDDGGTLKTFVGQARFRLPYTFLRDDFGIPDPETLTPSSLTGVVKKPDGSTAPGSFSVMQDPGGGAIYVDASGITFSVKQLRVRAGTIVPTRPTQVSATRTAPGRGFVDFEPSKARGANVTGYSGRCVVGEPRGDRQLRQHRALHGAPVRQGLRLQGAREVEGRPGSLERGGADEPHAGQPRLSTPSISSASTLLVRVTMPRTCSKPSSAP